MMNSFPKRPALFSSLLIACLFLASGLFGQKLPGTIVYSVPGMDKTEVRPDIIYRRDGGDEMRMDIYLPPGLAGNERRPAVLFVHGGPLGKNPSPGAKDWGVYRSYGRLMAASGLVGVTFDHRYWSMEEKDLERSFADVEEAIRFVRANAAFYHVDPERIALWAFSGGGPQLSIGLQGGKTYIRCLVSYYAILALDEPDAGRVPTPSVLERFSPVAWLTKAPDYLPPVLVARAGLDSPDINRSVGRFVSGMMALNGDVNLLSHPFGRHGFDIYDDDDQSRDVIAATVVFLKSRLARPGAFETKRARHVEELQTLFSQGRIGAAREFVRTALSAPGDKAVTDVLLAEARLSYEGSVLLKTNPTEAVTALEWTVERNPLSANAHAGLAAGYEAVGRKDLAVAEARKAIELLKNAADLSERRKTAVREAVEALLKRLK